MAQLDLFAGEQVPDTFYNTTHLRGPELRAAGERALTQNVLILDIFQRNKRLTPSTCQRMALVRGFDWPITSVRRSFTDLTKAGYLRKTEQLVMGLYGMPEHVWEVTGVAA